MSWEEIILTINWRRRIILGHTEQKKKKRKKRVVCRFCLHGYAPKISLALTQVSFGGIKCDSILPGFMKVSIIFCIRNPNKDFFIGRQDNQRPMDEKWNLNVFLWTVKKMYRFHPATSFSTKPFRSRFENLGKFFPLNVRISGN